MEAEDQVINHISQMIQVSRQSLTLYIVITECLLNKTYFPKTEQLQWLNFWKSFRDQNLQY